MQTLNVGLIAFVVYLLYRKAKEMPLGRLFFPALVIKILGGFTVGLIYFHHYKGGDTLGFFQASTQIASYAYDGLGQYLNLLFFNQVPQVPEIKFLYLDQPRAFFFSKLLSLFMLLTHNNYWITSIYLSVISFLGLWYMGLTVIKAFNVKAKAVALAFLFFPSVVFWSSGILKESIAMGAMGFFVGSFVKVYWLSDKVKVLDILIAVISFWFLWQLKYYYGGVLIAVMVIVSVVELINKRLINIDTVLCKCLAWVLVAIPVFSIATFLNPNFELGALLGVIVENHDASIQSSRPDNVIIYSQLENSWVSVIRNLPIALFAGLFRPLFYEYHPFIKVFSGLENLILMVLLLTNLKRMPSLLHSRYWALGFGLITYIFVLAIFLALSSPNLGTLVRYKVGFMPFLVLLASWQNPNILWLLKFLPFGVQSKLDGEVR